MNKIARSIIVICLFFSACRNGNETKSDSSVADVKDFHTLSNADSIILKHLELDIKVDFDRKQISGNATWLIDNKHELKTLKLDTYDMEIDSVLVDGKLAAFKLDSTVKYLGSALEIPIGPDSRYITVYYKTGKDAIALQWLDPQQTHDKKHSFLYTQSESIYARSWIPCADGPGIRFTYRARVEVPKGLMALMSARNPQYVNDSGIYHFGMEIPVPAYLMALAVGDINFSKIDDRTGVYAEPGMIEKARYEFEDVGKMVSTAEKLYGPYRWGRYDVLVLPPGFPIGGMENPRLTFCTPTIIAGDRSLVNLVAHELAHSWSGNLVTNATWNDFWLNEGFTNYFERRITEAMMGETFIEMSWAQSYEDLQIAVNELGKDNKDTWLKLDLKGRDPDDGLTDIAYEKGSLFLKLIEQTVGRERMDSFLRKYFDEHAFKTITTEEFLAYMDKNLIKGDTAVQNKINIKAWVYGPGIPQNCPHIFPQRFVVVDSAIKSFIAGKPVDKQTASAWSTYEWVHFLRNMPKPLSAAQMKRLDDNYKFTKTGNSEIADVWFVMSIASDYKAAFAAMDKFLSSVGRRKFLEPLYTEMMKTTNGKKMAEELYLKYKMNYHPLAQASIDKIILGK